MWTTAGVKHYSAWPTGKELILHCGLEALQIYSKQASFGPFLYHPVIVRSASFFHYFATIPPLVESKTGILFLLGKRVTAVQIASFLAVI